ncbi:MAG: zf-HC2 domain-containing protein [Gemmatimonadaceae bacterium]
MSDFRLPITCEQFEARVSDYIDGTLSMSERAIMDAHVSECTTCAATLAEVSAIVRQAAVLPPLVPSRDLWTDIENRLDTPVVSIGSASTRTVKVRRAVSFRMMAAAAVLLITMSSGATYWLTRASSTTGSQPTQVASTTVQPNTVVPAHVDATASGSAALPATATIPATAAPRIASGNEVVADVDPGVGGRTRTRYASNNGTAVEVVYEREITAMRRIVDERLGDLDSTTVLEIERNLRIIDKAISDSRRALQNDPRSRFLSSQLDRALENKLDVLRRIALL